VPIDKKGMVSMKGILRGRLLLALAVASLALVAGVAAAAAAPLGGAQVCAVTTWDFVPRYGSFAEGMALGADGGLYVSVTTWGDEVDLGQIERVSRLTGARTPFGERIDLGLGLLTGVAFDGGHLYVAEAFTDSPGVYRVEASGPPAQVLALPAESFPNGIAFHDGQLYVTDGSLGAIWRSDPGVFSTSAEPWLSDPLLAPGTHMGDHGIGANGIAFRGSQLYASVSDAGRVVRVAVRQDGSAGPLRVVLERGTLQSADGIAFDPAGDLWIVTNGPNRGRVLVVANGELTAVGGQPAWLDYPAMPVFEPSGSLFVENGSFLLGTPSIVELH
jgi:hypothetical protein